MSQFQDIIDFLATYPPYEALPSANLESVASRLKIIYIKAGEPIEVNKEPYLRVIRSGSIEIRTSDGQLLDRLGMGGSFGYGPMLTGDASSRRFTVLEDSLVYLIGKEDFAQLRRDHEDFDYFFARETRRRAERISKPLSKDVEMDLDVEQIMKTNLVCVAPEQSIQQTAIKMTEAKVSSALIIEQERLVGIVTDRDLRTRVVAENTATDAPVSAIMTEKPSTLAPDDSVHLAYITMMSRSINHMPITLHHRAVGIITLGDLLRARNSEPLFIIKAIHRADSVNGLIALSEKIPELIEKLILGQVSSEEIGKIITLTTDALTIRLLDLGQQQFGPAPCPFCWLAFGSQGRKEQ